MRISDWSSDVCSSDLSGTTSASNTTNVAKPIAPAKLPPAIEKSMTYRCQDNGIVSVDFLNDGLTATLRTDGNLAQLKANETRSEEHTSELQSLMRISYAVFCLKKKTQMSPIHSKYRWIHTQITVVIDQRYKTYTTYYSKQYTVR